MKLEIWRDQADVKGVFGGHKGVSFKLVTRVQLLPDETALIAKYKVGDDVLVTYELPGADRRLVFTITINQMAAGYTTNMRDIATMIQLEDEIKAGCHNLKNWLQVMASFGGYEAVEI
jgi:hypothetical protein